MIQNLREGLAANFPKAGKKCCMASQKKVGLTLASLLPVFSLIVDDGQQQRLVLAVGPLDADVARLGPE